MAGDTTTLRVAAKFQGQGSLTWGLILDPASHHAILLSEAHSALSAEGAQEANTAGSSIGIFRAMAHETITVDLR